MQIIDLERCARQHGDKLAGRPVINAALASRATGGAGGSGPTSGSLAGTAGGSSGGRNLRPDRPSSWQPQRVESHR